MSSVSGNSADQVAGAFPAAWAARARPALYAFAMMLLWTAVVRLPFYDATDSDEFFFAIIADGWLNGRLPYVDYFDIKPPGLFLLFTIAQGLFGISQATTKGLEIFFVALGGWALFMMLHRYATARVALWAAVLFPIYSLAYSGYSSAVMALQLPFLILGFWAVMSAIHADASEGAKLRGAFFAGLAIGAAGMIKQTALMEAIAAFGLLAYFGERSRWRMMGLFTVGAALPALGFSAYFLAVGHFREMFGAVVVLALKRTDPSVLAVYGPEKQWFLTTQGAAWNSLSLAITLIFLIGGALFVALRFRLIRHHVPTRLIVLSVSWLMMAYFGVVAGKAIVPYYALTLMPPLLILAGVTFSHGLEVKPERQAMAFCLAIVGATASLAYQDREALLSHRNFREFGAEEVAVATQLLQDFGLASSDRVLVLNRGFEVYIETKAQPPTAYLHPMHIIGTFITPSPDPLGETLAANARFVLVAGQHLRRPTDEPARIERAEAYLAEHYRVAAEVRGAKDSFTIYEFVR